LFVLQQRDGPTAFGNGAKEAALRRKERAHGAQIFCFGPEAIFAQKANG
jgi:hypothetical protein